MASFARPTTPGGAAPEVGAPYKRGLRSRFDEYSAFGGTNAGRGLTSKNFAKLARDCALLDKRLTLTQLDLVFAKSITRGAKKLGWAEFLHALELCAATKRIAVEKLHETVAASAGPSLTATTAAERVRFHDDKTTYTGVHVGKGDGVRGGPTHVDNKLTLDSLADRSAADVRGVKKGLVYTDSHAGVSSGHHVGLSPAARPTSAAKTPRPAAAASPRPKPPPVAMAGSVPAPAAPPNYFDLLTRYFVKHNPAKAGNVGVLLTQYAGREPELFAKMEAKYGDPVISGGGGTSAGSGGGIFDKLTDTSLYTGHHKQRFDGDGKGRGLAGRDYVAKGGGCGTGRPDTAHAYTGSTNAGTDTVFHDSSQFLMR